MDPDATRASKRPKKQAASGTRSAKGGESAEAESAKKTSATLMMAAKAASVSGTAGTIQQVLERTALGHYEQGVRQYLAIRLGDVEEGDVVYAKLRDRVADIGIETLSESPGVRARLYRLARELASEAAAAKPPKSTKTLMWFGGASTSAGVQALREDARAGDRELLELRHARNLDTQEMAFVLELAPDEVTAKLRAAEEDARSLFASGRRVDLPKALLEAFALEALQSDLETPTDEVHPRLPEGTLLDGRYELEKHVGEGGFADVYRARDVAVDGHVVALKVLKQPSKSKRTREAALRELRLIAAVFHPSIVQFKDHGWHDDRFWFVMPWYEGESLEDRLAAGPMPRAEARQIFEPLARALATMHGAKIRHQDVKPDNIFLAQLEGGEGEENEVLPVLLDLGVAATDAELVLAGTPTYFAPEVAAQFAYQEGDPFPDRPIGPMADVYALALSLRNALEPETQPDVLAGNVDAFIRERSVEEPPLPTHADLRYLRPHFARWLHPDPLQRPTAHQFVRELAVLTQPEERRARRMRILRVFGPILASILIVFGVVAHRLIEDARLHEEKAVAADAAREEALADLEDSNATQADLRNDIQEAQSRIQNAHLSRQALEEQLAESQARLASEQRRLRRLQRNLTEVRKQLEAAEEQLEARARELAAAQRTITSLREDVASRDRDLEAAGRQRARLESERDAAQAQVTALRGELQEAQAATRAAEARARSAESQRDQAIAAQRQAEQERDQAQRELTAAERRIRQLERAGSSGGGTGGTGGGSTGGTEPGGAAELPAAMDVTSPMRVGGPTVMIRR